MLREREEAISFNSGLEPGVSVIEEYVAGPYGSDSEVAIPIGNDARYLGGRKLERQYLAGSENVWLRVVGQAVLGSASLLFCEDDGGGHCVLAKGFDKRSVELSPQTVGRGDFRYGSSLEYTSGEHCKFCYGTTPDGKQVIRVGDMNSTNGTCVRLAEPGRGPERTTHG